jgi:hypothetical protein
MKLRSGKWLQSSDAGNTFDLIFSCHVDGDRHLSYMETVKRIGSIGTWWPGMFADVTRVVRSCGCRTRHNIHEEPVEVIDVDEEEDDHVVVFVEEEPSMEEEQNDASEAVHQEQPVEVIDLTKDDEPSTDFPSPTQPVTVSFDDEYGFIDSEKTSYSETVSKIRKMLYRFSKVEEHCLSLSSADMSPFAMEIIASFDNVRKISGIQRDYTVTISKYQQLMAAHHLMATYQDDWSHYAIENSITTL